MYSENDFRYYKKKQDNYLAHYGVKGMKWHKHLKAATDWLDKNVTGSTARENMLKAQRGYHRWSTGDSFHPEIRTAPNGKKVYRDSNRLTAAGTMRSDYNRDNVKAKKEYDKSLRGKIENTARVSARRTVATAHKVGRGVKSLPGAIDKNITGSTAKQNARYYDQEYRYNQRKAVAATDTAVRAKKYLHDNKFARRSISESRREADRYNKEAVNYLEKRNKARASYDSSLRGKAEKKLKSIFKKRKKKK